MPNNKNSFIVYHDLSIILNEISDENIGKLFRAMIEYSSTGKIVDLPDILKLVFLQIRQAMDRNAIKWEELSEARSQYGRKGGLVSAESRWGISKSKQTQASVSKITVTVPVTVSDTNRDFPMETLEQKKDRERDERMEQFQKEREEAHAKWKRDGLAKLGVTI